MASIINSDSTNGLTLTSDTSGTIEIQSGGTKVGEITSSGVTNDSLQNSTISINGNDVALGGTADMTQDYMMLAAAQVVSGTNHGTYAAGARIKLRNVESAGSISLASTGLMTIGRAGTYLIVVSFLFNTGNAGTNGDGRIRKNGSNQAAFYALASDTATWEKSVGTCVLNCAVNDTIDFICQSTQYIWATASGYTHSPAVIIRIGD